MSFSPSRLLLPLSIVVLAGCAGQQKPVVTLDDADDCSPLKLTQGQELVLTLPSNPTTGFCCPAQPARTTMDNGSSRREGEKDMQRSSARMERAPA